MTAAARANEPPYTVETLATRWNCSPGAIRNRIKSGELRTFRIGALIRIPANEVERVECLSTVSNGSAGASPSSTTMAPEPVAERSLMRPIGLGRRQRLGSAGG